jgi:glycosyltransferase involved in cell wall biosynthesis
MAGVPKIVFTAHGWPFLEKRDMVTRAFIYFASYVSLLLTHVTICISEYDYRAVVKLPFAKSRLRIIRNGLSPITFLPRIEARERLFTENDMTAHKNDLWLVSNGELHPNKNYIAALDAIAEYNKTHAQKIFYSIIGDGEERANIEAHIKKLSLTDHVRILGFIGEAPTYLRAFDLFFLPSLKEGVPYVLLEAGRAHLPVVATAVGGIPEIVEDTKTGILSRDASAGMLSDALDRMTEYNNRDELAQALYEAVTTKYTMQGMLAAIISMYNK